MNNGQNARKYPKIEVGAVINGRAVVAEGRYADNNGYPGTRKLLMRCLDPACGEESWGSEGGVRRGNGCPRCRVSRGSPGEATWRGLFLRAFRGAVARGYVWLLSLDQYRDLAQRSCFYCGAPPPSRNRYLHRDGSRMSGNTVDARTVARATVFAHGLDRYDNAEGYYYENCVPCCSDCNVAKRDMPAEDFVALAQRIMGYQSSARGQRRRAEFLASRPQPTQEVA